MYYDVINFVSLKYVYKCKVIGKKKRKNFSLLSADYDYSYYIYIYIYIYIIYIYNISRLRPIKSGKQNPERGRETNKHIHKLLPK